MFRLAQWMLRNREEITMAIDFLVVLFFVLALCYVIVELFLAMMQ